MSRVLSQVQHIAEQLGKPDPTITDKLVDNLRELLELAPELNLGGDPVIGELLRDCRQSFSSHPTRCASLLCNAARSRWRRGASSAALAHWEDASWPHERAGCSIVRRRMSPKHRQLHEHHRDTACLMASASEPIFWVLDLEDPRAFEIALASGQEPARLRDSMASIQATGCIPALTVLTTLEVGNRMLCMGWQVKPLAQNRRYLAIVSDGRLSVGTLP